MSNTFNIEDYRVAEGYVSASQALGTFHQLVRG